MEEATHYWTGQKPLRRCIPGAWNAYVEVIFGQSFVPSSAELQAFPDKLRPLELGPPLPPTPQENSSLRTGPDHRWG